MWTKELDGEARTEGWALCTVFDNGSSRPFYMVISVGGFSSSNRAMQHVIDRARESSNLHITALRTVMNDRINPTRKK